MATYYGIIHKDSDSDYGISFPDLPGCISSGSTLEELDVMAREALKLHLDGMAEDGEEIPSPSDYHTLYEAHSQEKGFVGVTLVSAPIKVKRIRVNISLPAEDLKLIDAVADRYGLDRSGFMVMAAKKVASGVCEL